MKYYFIELAEHVTRNSAYKNVSINIIDDSNTVFLWVQSGNQVPTSLILNDCKGKELKSLAGKK